MDVGQCRIVVNALMREIDRLRRGIDHTDMLCINAPWPQVDCEADAGACECPPAASPSSGSGLYGPPPLAKLPPVSGDQAPMDAAIEIRNYFHVTNMGTLLDVFA